MAIVIDDLQMERLAEQIARLEGVSVTEVVRESLLSLAGLRGLGARKPALRERLAALALEVDAVPPRMPPDTRSANEILGYDEHGVW
ncbi:type II toxin-antitoxin system VapB family antitoxin [uncultured Thiodictyon sp.]|uniref:type II toxin-antitoxin system VapB family antitoxin n=1 Tax=uncultured Thiodictyon sp. TaxID=1846217 RepID=UPI0025FE7068|nr:type II toxin-antitoxin system VapB family antitoxin [uncultured Thiodictyon sp.]